MTIKQLTPDKGPVVGFCLVAHPNIVANTSATVSLEEDKEENKLEVPLTFMGGDLNTVRSELHKLIDDFIDQLDEEA